MSYSSISRRHGIRRRSQPAPLTTRNWAPASPELIDTQAKRNVVIDCGWGRLIFGHTFASNEDIVEELKHEEPDRRDIAMYLRDPHVVLSLAPQDLFLDPSHTFRLSLDQYRPARRPFKGFFIRQLTGGHDPEQVNRILGARDMVPIAPSFLHRHRMSRTLTFLVAEDETTGAVIGFVMGVDHKRAFGDAEGGSSLWSLAVDPQAQASGVGEALVRQLAESYLARNRAFMDLSVMHDNNQAIALYKKLGFRRVPVFTIKGKNSINEKLFTGPQVKTGLNPYAQIIVDEARRRGIHVSVLDADNGYFALTHGGRRIVCRESLSELTTAVAMSRCDDKSVTRRLLSEAGLTVPAQKIVADDDAAKEFLKAHRRVVVKPARGEQGAGISVDLDTWRDVKKALKLARSHADKVIMEEYVEGRDLRIIVIDYKVVAAAIRRPARIVGNGRDTVTQLIEKQSRRRGAATGGESRIPMDAETERCVKAAGHSFDDVPAEGEAITVRKTANLHTGGTIHDVTDRLHPRLIDAAVRGAQALDIPVVGFDFLVPDITGPDYVIIEANERPGLANHEPQPTAERFVDLLFPQTIVRQAAG
jgi:GNAT-family acetyltransferase (TIGR03103 family)